MNSCGKTSVFGAGPVRSWSCGTCMSWEFDNWYHKDTIVYQIPSRTFVFVPEVPRPKEWWLHSFKGERYLAYKVEVERRGIFMSNKEQLTMKFNLDMPDISIPVNEMPEDLYEQISQAIQTVNQNLPRPLVLPKRG